MVQEIGLQVGTQCSLYALLVFSFLGLCTNPFWQRRGQHRSNTTKTALVFWGHAMHHIDLVSI